jgi:hypothetical protein
VDQPLIDRRMDARFPPPRSADTRATLRPGCTVLIVDLSAGGALVEALRPLRPGARVHLQLVTEQRTLALPAHVLRCAVWSLDARDGATYRGALKFENRCDLFREAETRRGSLLPRGAALDGRHSGHRLPADEGTETSRHRTSAK